MSSAAIAQFVAHEESAARALSDVATAADALAVEASRRGDGAELARLRSFQLSVAALAEANKHRAAVWASLAAEQDKATHSPTPPPEFKQRISDAASLDDLAAVVDDAEIGCAGVMVRGLGNLAGSAVRRQVAQAVAAIGDGLALTRAAIGKDPTPWPGVPAG
ncbi:MAG: hypothetical protein DCC49_03180 [Acidobacteria bacterium]|nr:MAG: hypothetical protein DCC49_03180 [Acidobacteriota bacterium]